MTTNDVLTRMIASGAILVFGIIVSNALSAQQQVQAALRESEEKWRSLVESAPATFMTLNCTGVIQFASCPFEGRPIEKLIGRKIYEFLPPEYEDQLEEIFANVMRTGQHDRVEVAGLTLPNPPLYACRVGPVIHEGRVKALSLIITDITKRRRHQEELARAKRLETAGRLAAQIAHDFNNLLTPLVAIPDLLRQSIPPELCPNRLLDNLDHATSQLVEINQELLTLGRRGHYKHEPLDLNTLLKQTLSAVGFPRTVVIENRLAADLFPVQGGRAQLLRVLANVTANAIGAMDGTGTLTVETKNVYLDSPFQGSTEIAIGEYVQIDVSDTGEGIPADVIDRIFEPFFTTKSADRRRGSGLGMSVVHSVVEDHGGYINVRSTVGQGTTVTLYFPIYRGELEADVVAGAIPRGGGERVLVVDDDPLQLNTVRFMLEQLGYEVAVATSGEQAVECTRDHPPDVVVLDMVMDGIDGTETLRRIKEHHPDQIAILLSGYATSDRVAEAMSLGAREFLAKPVRVPILGTAVHNALRDRATRSGDEFTERHRSPIASA